MEEIFGIFRDLLQNTFEIKSYRTKPMTVPIDLFSQRRFVMNNTPTITPIHAAT